MTGRIVVDGPESVDVTRLPVQREQRVQNVLRRAAWVRRPPFKVNRDRTFEVGNVDRISRALDQRKQRLVRSVHDARESQPSRLAVRVHRRRGAHERASRDRVAEPRPCGAMSSTHSGLQSSATLAIVIPEDPQALQSGRLTRRVGSDLNGRFQIASLPPGSYLAIAMTRPDPIDWSTPEYLTGFVRTRRASCCAGEEHGDARVSRTAMSAPRTEPLRIERRPEKAALHEADRARVHDPPLRCSWRNRDGVAAAGPRATACATNAARPKSGRRASSEDGSSARTAGRCLGRKCSS